MRAVILEVDERMLAERRRLGLDRKDEMWEGVLHMVPAPFARHGRIQAGLAASLYDRCTERDLMIGVETAVFAVDDDYRVPDLVVYAPESASDRGVEGAPVLVVEVRSPSDESLAKVPWYLGRGAGSVVVVDAVTFSVEVFSDEGKAEADADGLTQVAGLAVRLGPASDGDGLVVETEKATHRIRG
jgi:Uma2 family endonuclease